MAFTLELERGRGFGGTGELEMENVRLILFEEKLEDLVFGTKKGKKKEGGRETRQD